MANPFDDATQELEKAQKLLVQATEDLGKVHGLIGNVLGGLNNAMKLYEENAESDDQEHPPSSQLPA